MLRKDIFLKPRFLSHTSFVKINIPHDVECTNKLEVNFWSLFFILTYCRIADKPTTNQKVIVLAQIGTNLKYSVK